MSNKIASWMAILAVGMLACSSLWAQTAPAPTAAETRKPIVCKLTTLEGMQYYHLGSKIDGDDKLWPLLAPMNDPEINRLVGVSKGSHTAGVVLLVGGTGLLVGGLVVAGDNYNNQTQSFNSSATTGLLLALVGAVGDYVGAFKLDESLTSKFAAVQRYNALVRGEDETVTSWNLPRDGFRTDVLAFKF